MTPKAKSGSHAQNPPGTFHGTLPIEGEEHRRKKGKCSGPQQDPAVPGKPTFTLSPGQETTDGLSGWAFQKTPLGLESLAELHLRSELSHRLLPLSDFMGRGWLQEPLSQDRLTRREGDGGEQAKKGGFPTDVQVEGIGVTRIRIFKSYGREGVPIPGYPGKCHLVDPDEGFEPLPPGTDSPVPHHQKNE
jgi:hypothetical protein